jgi:hypothetical protein
MGDDDRNGRNRLLTLVETIQIVTVLNDFVENGYSKDIKDRFEKIDQLVFGKKP